MWTAISGATSSTYRPVADDVLSYLRATAAYTDSLGSGKNAQQKTDAQVAAAPTAPTVTDDDNDDVVDDGAPSAGVNVTVDDGETAVTDAGVTVSETALPLGEGAGATYTVVLDTQPASNVVITVSSDNADVTASPATLTFTTANWDTAQTVTVSAAHDADAANDAASITHAVVAAESPDEYHAVSIAGVSVTVTDDDADAPVAAAPTAPAGVTVSETALPLDEGASSTYTVVLDTQPQTW